MPDDDCVSYSRNASCDALESSSVLNSPSTRDELRLMLDICSPKLSKYEIFLIDLLIGLRPLDLSIEDVCVLISFA